MAEIVQDASIDSVVDEARATLSIEGEDLGLFLNATYSA